MLKLSRPAEWIVWPERKPEEAVRVKTYPALWWKLIGPMAYKAMFRSLRMTTVSLWRPVNVDPVEIAKYYDSLPRFPKCRKESS